MLTPALIKEKVQGINKNKQIIPEPEGELPVMSQSSTLSCAFLKKNPLKMINQGSTPFSNERGALILSIVFTIWSKV